MVRWGWLGGSVQNYSKQRLVISYDHPTQDQTWAYSFLEPGQNSPLDLDVDGFRVYATDANAIFSSPWDGKKTTHKGWWKLRNGHIAVANDDPTGIDFSILTDDGFGLVTWASMPQAKSDADFEWNYAKATIPLIVIDGTGGRATNLGA